MLHPIIKLKRAMATFMGKLRELFQEQSNLRREYESNRHDLSLLTPDNPAIFGYKVYSQFDEDGIIAHIFSRIGNGDRIFVEIGCSDGLENNTHALLLQGWRGAWFDADARKIRFISEQLPVSPRLVVKQEYVSVKNVHALVSNALENLDVKTIDFLSIDIDGDDLNVLTALLNQLKPRVICAEYNAKFPPPMKVQIQFEQGVFWSGDDYHGASLASFSDALRMQGYRLITCGISGVNAFFVRDCEAGDFPTFPIEHLYRPAMYHFRHLASGHPPSLKFLADALARDQAQSKPA